MVSVMQERALVCTTSTLFPQCPAAVLVWLLQPLLPGVATLVGGTCWPATRLPEDIRHPVPSPERGNGMLGATTPEP